MGYIKGVNIGWILCLIITTISLSTAVFAFIDNSDLFSEALNIKSNGVNAPSNIILDNNILVYNNYTIINQSGISYFTVTPTKSMLPFIDEGNHALAISVNNESNIHIGDIISYINPHKDIILHRVIEINKDEGGIYYILKGDNNFRADSYKVKFENITNKVIGVIY